MGWGLGYVSGEMAGDGCSADGIWHAGKESDCMIRNLYLTRVWEVPRCCVVGCLEGGWVAEREGDSGSVGDRAGRHVDAG